ncbi:MAG: T9SS type A sorting domain-containing protein [bacterium]|nr:T9SS type A sorting domain-containing protein [bacterium]
MFQKIHKKLKVNRIFFLIFLTFFLKISPSNAKREPFFPIIERAIPQNFTKNGIQNLETGKIIFLHVSDNVIASSESEYDEVFRIWYYQHYRELGLKQPVSIKLIQTQETPGGKVLRYRQHQNEIISYENDLVAQFDKSRKLISIHHHLDDELYVLNTTPTISSKEAVDFAKQFFPHTGETHAPIVNLYIWKLLEFGSQLVYRVILSPIDPIGEYEILVSAVDGSHLRTRETTCYIDGTGLVFNPDPLTSAQQSYGGNWRDNNDADNNELNGQRVTRSLRNITFQSNSYSLVGPFVQLIDFEPPTVAPVTATIPDGFQFTRSQQGFEDVMVYAHIDSCQRYIQALGFMNIQNLSIGVDPHGLSGADNSHFLPSTNRLAFGEGGVDDAEDVDVLWHEYGHAIQYSQVNNWGGGESGSLGEGFGDYWAGSYSANVSNFRREWVFNWDGHNEYWNGRILNTNAIYPSGMGSSIHTNGQIWSRALMDIWDSCGRTVTDRIVLQGQFAVGYGVTYPTLANAILNADVLLYQGQHLNQIFTAFQNRGILTQMPPIASISGVISANATGSPISNALIYLNGILRDTSNADGSYWIGNLGLSTYFLRIVHPLYNEKNDTVVISAPGNVVRNQLLTRPIYSCSPDSVYINIQNLQNDTLTIPLLTTMTNVGDGDGRYELELISGNGLEQWSFQREWNVGQLFNDIRLQGVEYDNSGQRRLIFTGSNNNQNPNKWYLWNHFPEGTQIDVLNQLTNTDIGYRDIDRLGTDFITGENDTIWRITGFNNSSEIRTPLFNNVMINPPRAIASQQISNDSSIIWIADNTSPVKKFSTNGQLLSQISHNRRITAIVPERYPNGKIWFLSTDNNYTQLWVSEIDSSHTQIVPIAQLQLPEGFRSSGACYYEESDIDAQRYLCVLLTSPTQAILRTYQLPKPCRYATLSVPTVGLLIPNTNVQLGVNLRLDTNRHTFHFSILQKRNPSSGRMVTVYLSRFNEVKDRNLFQPTTFEITRIYPNPFNMSSYIQYSIPTDDFVSIEVYDVIGRKVFNEKEFHRIGVYTKRISLQEYPSGIYFIQLGIQQQYRISKLILLK